MAALDRSYRDVLSSSPLKMRVDYDLRPEGTRRESSPDNAQQVEFAMTPNRSSKKLSTKSPARVGRTESTSVMIQSK